MKKLSLKNKIYINIMTELEGIFWILKTVKSSSSIKYTCPILLNPCFAAILSASSTLVTRTANWFKNIGVWRPALNDPDTNIIKIHKLTLTLHQHIFKTRSFMIIEASKMISDAIFTDWIWRLFWVEIYAVIRLDNFELSSTG